MSAPQTRNAAIAGSDGYEPWRSALVTATRMAVGGVTVIVALMAASMNLSTDVPVDLPLLVFATVLALGGVALLNLSTLRPRPGWPGLLAGAATTVGGLVLAVFRPVRQACCDAAYTYAWGLPLPWRTGGGDSVADAQGTGWGTSDLDTVSAVADVVFWAYAGLLVLVAVGVLRRALRDRVGARP